MREQGVPELPVCEGPALPGHALSTSSFGELIAPLAVLGRVRLEALGRVGVPVEVLGREVDTEFGRVPVSAPSKEVEEELNSVLARAGERSEDPEAAPHLKRPRQDDAGSASSEEDEDGYYSLVKRQKKEKKAAKKSKYEEEREAKQCVRLQFTLNLLLTT